mmetsp:Transcript_58746/g.88638  ORF Transcript_58746/g.88638 Transcript_58746/m.88638 type:complete len:116 (-) Transcript_58746:20-367(-)
MISHSDSFKAVTVGEMVNPWQRILSLEQQVADLQRKLGGNPPSSPLPGYSVVKAPPAAQKVTSSPLPAYAVFESTQPDSGTKVQSSPNFTAFQLPSTFDQPPKRRPNASSLWDTR